MVYQSTTEIAQTFESHRTYLFGLAYRMLGSVMEAEDVVQDAYLRYEAAAKSESIDVPKAYLTTIVTRLSLDVLKSARVQREEYVGPWLPEPLPTGAAPSDLVLKRESLTVAFLTILEQLSPLERAVYLLREVFEYGYRDIAGIVEKSEANCRQLFSRSRKYLSNLALDCDTNSEVASTRNKDTEQQQRLIGAFLFAIEEQDMGTLTSLLAEDIRFESDGGGKVTAAIHPIEGRERVIKFVLGIQKFRPENLGLEFAEINGLPSIIMKDDGKIFGTWSVGIQDDRIRNLWAVLNPDKLGGLSG